MVPGSSPGGPTENKALTSIDVGAFIFSNPICLYSREVFLIYLRIKNTNFKWFMRITEELKTRARQILLIPKSVSKQ